MKHEDGTAKKNGKKMSSAGQGGTGRNGAERDVYVIAGGNYSTGRDGGHIPLFLCSRRDGTVVLHVYSRRDGIVCNVWRDLY